MASQNYDDGHCEKLLHDIDAKLKNLTGVIDFVKNFDSSVRKIVREELVRGSVKKNSVRGKTKGSAPNPYEISSKSSRQAEGEGQSRGCRGNRIRIFDTKNQLCSGGAEISKSYGRGSEKETKQETRSCRRNQAKRRSSSGRRSCGSSKESECQRPQRSTSDQK